MRSSQPFARRLLGALALLAGLSIVTVAQGAVVQQFGFQVKDVTPDGRYTLVFSSSSFDAEGGVLDTLTQDYIRFPKGAVVRRTFINKKYYCDPLSRRTRSSATRIRY